MQTTGESPTNGIHAQVPLPLARPDPARRVGPPVRIASAHPRRPSRARNARCRWSARDRRAARNCLPAQRSVTKLAGGAVR
jgi:hypothetical protein